MNKSSPGAGRQMSSSEQMPTPATYESILPSGQPFSLKYSALLFVVVLLLFGVLSISLAKTLRPQSDEGTYANPGYNLVYNGHSGTTLMELRGNLPPSLGKRTYWQFPVYFFLSAIWFKLVGFGLFKVRLLSVLFGGIAIVSWYEIVKQLSKSSAAGLLAMALVSVDYFFALGASQGRMEMVCAGFGAAALAAYLGLRERSLSAAFFAGHVFATLSIATHAVGILYWLGLVLLILSLDRHSLSIRVLLAGLAPCVIGGAIWGAFILKDPEAFVAQMRAQLNGIAIVFDDPSLSHIGIIRSAQLEIRHRYIEPFGLAPELALTHRAKAIVLATYVSAILGCLLVWKTRRLKGSLLIAALSLIAALYLTFVAPSKYPYYLPHVTPFFASCLAVFVFSMRSWRHAKRIFPAVVLIVAAIQLAGNVYRIREDPVSHSYVPTLAAIRSHSTPQSTIIGDAALWLGLEHDRYLLNDWYLGGISGVVPDVFVMDPLYRVLHEEKKQPLFGKVQNMLDSSRLVYNDGYYQVYVHQPDQPPAISR